MNEWQGGREGSDVICTHHRRSGPRSAECECESVTLIAMEVKSSLALPAAPHHLNRSPTCMLNQEKNLESIVNLIQWQHQC
jgi:hypothetical protein